ncbi:MAG: 1-deoxy-D-xylulose-5-phosphate reductoisomerase [Firmicutes bacterium]|nr:1-deoxy-D-xylulose-5-phosphate reductoisomerase [Bacillota bacterium]
MKHVSLLGSTGSIGRQTLDICARFPAELQVAALAGGSNVELLAAQALEFRPRLVAVADESKYAQLKELLGAAAADMEVLAGEAGVIACAEAAEADIVLGAISGVAGLKPVLAALQQGKDIALANKEVLVAGGQLVMPLAKEKNAALLPVDSEHSAIFQCLQGEVKPQKLWLTCSGGPFWEYPAEQLPHVTPEMALRHPNWSMGAKITIDSATLVNKGLEVIEAHWLFDMDYDDIEVLVHRQSIVHSLVSFADASVKAQLGLPDMRTPIQYALLYPNRPENALPKLDLTTTPPLTFVKPDTDRFPGLRLAYEAGRRGSGATVAFNAANEALVHAFLRKEISFGTITDGLSAVMSRDWPALAADLDTVVALDAEARELAARFTKGGKL